MSVELIERLENIDNEVFFIKDKIYKNNMFSELENMYEHGKLDIITIKKIRKYILDEYLIYLGLSEFTNLSYDIIYETFSNFKIYTILICNIKHYMTLILYLFEHIFVFGNMHVKNIFRDMLPSKPDRLFHLVTGEHIGENVNGISNLDSDIIENFYCVILQCKSIYKIFLEYNKDRVDRSFLRHNEIIKNRKSTSKFNFLNDEKNRSKEIIKEFSVICIKREHKKRIEIEKIISNRKVLPYCMDLHFISATALCKPKNEIMMLSDLLLPKKVYCVSKLRLNSYFNMRNKYIGLIYDSLLSIPVSYKNNLNVFYEHVIKHYNLLDGLRLFNSESSIKIFYRRVLEHDGFINKRKSIVCKNCFPKHKNSKQMCDDIKKEDMNIMASFATKYKSHSLPYKNSRI